MRNLIEKICGETDLIPNFDEIGNNPNYVFVNDPNFDTIRLFDFEGNIVNVNSWIECAHYVNGGWTNNVSDFVDGERIVFIALFLISVIVSFLDYRFNFFKRI